MKQPSESHLEYKKRSLDPVSGSFCAAKWLNSTIWLGSGRTASCHHPPAHRICAEDLAADPSALHNTPFKKKMRSLMQRGERPPECEYCWRIEDMGRGAVSDRVFKTMVYSDKDVAACAKLAPSENVNPRTLEIAFDRTCNFACAYCNPSFSSRWGTDVARNGPYRGLEGDGAPSYESDGSKAEPYRERGDNPYVQAFWKWWPSLAKDLEELRVTGGEPLLSPELWRLFARLKRNPRPKLLFSVNSNLGVRDELIEKLIEKSHGVPSFDLYTSCEAVGEQAEYVRDGLKYERFLANVRKIAERARLRQLNFMMTVNALCLYSLTDFMDVVLGLKKAHRGRFTSILSLNILRFPSFMSVSVLPEEIRRERREHLARWLDSRRDDPDLHEMERDSVARLIDYLALVRSPHEGASPLASRRRDFKAFFEQYDQRRGKRFADVFPQPLSDWYRSL